MSAPHKSSLVRLMRDLQYAHAAGVAVWRIVPVPTVLYHYKRWAIYRNGVRMWTKNELGYAVDYVRKYAFYEGNQWSKSK